MPVIDSCCCGKGSLKSGSIVIGVLMLIFSVTFLFVTIGLVAGWEDFDTEFLVRLNSTTANKTVEKLHKLTAKLEEEEIRPVWKHEFISLFCFLPWYALANILLIIGAKKEIRLLLLLWIAFTIGFLIWSFVLISILFSYDTTPKFVAGIASAQCINFAILTAFVLVVCSYYEELRSRKIKEIILGSTRGEEYLHTQEQT